MLLRSLFLIVVVFSEVRLLLRKTSHQVHNETTENSDIKGNVTGLYQVFIRINNYPQHGC